MCAVQPLHTSELETSVGQKSLQRLLKKVYKSEVPTRCRIKLLFTVWFVRRSCLPKLLETKKRQPDTKGSPFEHRASVMESMYQFLSWAPQPPKQEHNLIHSTKPQ